MVVDQARIEQVAKELARHFNDPQNKAFYAAEFDRLPDDEKWRIHRAAKELLEWFDRWEARPLSTPGWLTREFVVSWLTQARGGRH